MTLMEVLASGILGDEEMTMVQMSGVFYSGQQQYAQMLLILSLKD